MGANARWIKTVGAALISSLTLVALSSVPVSAAPACGFTAANGDYVDGLKSRAETAAERGRHVDSTALYERAASYMASCALIVGREVDAKMGSASSDVSWEYFTAANLYEDAAAEAKAAKAHSRECRLARSAADLFRNQARERASDLRSPATFVDCGITI